MQDRERLEQIRASVNGTLDHMQEQLDGMEDVAQTLDRLAAAAAHADDIVDQVGRDFAKATGLNGKDLCFLFAATALQCLRQYVLEKPIERDLHDKSELPAHNRQDEMWHTADRLKEGTAGKQLSGWYRASKEEILYTYSVPFDVMGGTKDFGVGGHAELGLGGKTHRFKTLGHDPLYGWVFGTGNIMTNTLTNYRMSTYHVKGGKVVAYGNTGKMLRHFWQRSKSEPDVFAMCVIKEGLHLSSDMYSKMGIPLPGIERWSGPEAAHQLVEYGMDCGLLIKMAKQSEAAMVINLLIGMLHRLTMGGPEEDRRLLEVRTRKILLWSNCLATASNVIKTAVESGAGIAARDPAVIKHAAEGFDWGGLLVTGYRLVKDVSFIRRVEKEFLEERFYEKVMQEIYEGGAV